MSSTPTGQNTTSGSSSGGGGNGSGVSVGQSGRVGDVEGSSSSIGNSSIGSTSTSSGSSSSGGGGVGVSSSSYNGSNGSSGNGTTAGMEQDRMGDSVGNQNSEPDYQIIVGHAGKGASVYAVGEDGSGIVQRGEVEASTSSTSTLLGLSGDKLQQKLMQARENGGNKKMKAREVDEIDFRGEWMEYVKMLLSKVGG